VNSAAAALGVLLLLLLAFVTARALRISATVSVLALLAVGPVVAFVAAAVYLVLSVPRGGG
jgi:uncharacterized protein YhdP